MKRQWKVLPFLALVLGVFAASGFAADKGFPGDDQKFFKEAASGGMMEVQMGQMAQQKGQSQEVKDFGGKMVKDHGKANEELKALAQQKNAKMPDKLESKHKKAVDKFGKASGAEFDRQYMETMVKDHTTDVEDFKNVGLKAKDPDLKGWATKTLPVLEDHLKQASDIAQKMGIDVNKVQEQGLKDAKKSK